MTMCHVWHICRGGKEVGMKMLEKQNKTQKGSLMVEAIALLGLITMVTPILYRKAAERTTELQDINVATQMRMVSSAVDDFIRDNYNEIGESHGGEVFKLTDAELEKLDKYLPYGFSTQKSRLFDDFDISVRKKTVVDKNDNEHHIYTSAVLAPLRDNITMMRSSKIASMIGSNGGVYRQIGKEDGSTEYKIEGVQGSWEASLDDYDFSPDGVKDGSLVVISTKAIGSVRGDVSSDEALYRIDDGDETKNTMQTTLYMDGNEIRGVRELIAKGGSGGDVIIGKNSSLTSNLIVTGTTNLKQALTVDGDTNLNGDLTVDGNTVLNQNLTVKGDATVNQDLTVKGDTNLANTTITGNLTQSGGDINFNPNKFTLNSKGDVVIDAAGNTSIGGTNVNIEGDESVNINVGDNGITVDQSGNTITGDTQFNDGDVTINKGDLIVDGGEIIVIPENPDDETGILADWLYASKGIKVGGKTGTNKSPGNYFTVDSSGVDVKSGSLNVRDNFYADNSTVDITTDSFAVGGKVGTAGNKINVNGSSAFIGNSYASNGTHDGLLVKSASLVLRNASGKLAMENSEVTLSSSNSRVKLDKNSVVVGVGTEDAEVAKMIATASKVGFENTGSGTGSAGTSLYLENGKMKFGVRGNTQILGDEYGLAIAGKGGNLTGNSVKVGSNGGVNATTILDGAKVAISREGIIEVAAPTTTDNDGGFIRARRLVSDVPYPSGSAFDGFTSSGGTPTNGYDYYQVNPAYTSVMNDIKLASRGGARLSDILPDYINKGIYVVDNTYKMDKIGDWTSLSVSGGKPSLPSGAECSDNSCVASPWMGFVPAPQCPKNYAKVITINPIRWRMSEVYAVYGASSFNNSGEYKKIISGNNFGSYFWRQTNPKQAEFELLPASGGSEHTHYISSGFPLTFQTNTWLNTTMSENFGGKSASGSISNFQGWHTIMGFIYRPSQYQQLLSDIGYSIDSTDIYWNVFPVYAQDLAAVTNVYCYFDRHPLTSGTSRTWTWGSSPVYQYDQLNNYRQGYKKGAVSGAAAWGSGSSNDGSQVNDPTLGYDDAW